MDSAPSKSLFLLVLVTTVCVARAGDRLEDCDDEAVQTCGQKPYAEAHLAKYPDSKCKYVMQVRACYDENCDEVNSKNLQSIKQLMEKIELDRDDCPLALVPKTAGATTIARCSSSFVVTVAVLVLVFVYSFLGG